MAGEKRKTSIAATCSGLKEIEIMRTVAATSKAGITELRVVMSSSGSKGGRCVSFSEA